MHKSVGKIDDEVPQARYLIHAASQRCATGRRMPEDNQAHVVGRRCLTGTFI